MHHATSKLCKLWEEVLAQKVSGKETKSQLCPRIYTRTRVVYITPECNGRRCIVRETDQWELRPHRRKPEGGGKLQPDRTFAGLAQLQRTVCAPKDPVSDDNSLVCGGWPDWKWNIQRFLWAKSKIIGTYVTLYKNFLHVPLGTF